LLPAPTISTSPENLRCSPPSPPKATRPRLPALTKQLDRLDLMRPLLRVGRIREAAKRSVKGGATPEELEQTTTVVVGEVADAEGRTAITRLHGPEGGRVWTAFSALAVVKRVIAGDFRPGYRTPAMVYGSDLVFAAEGITWEDLV
jgi:short subunit dehydrogenase-like uncharacterized protein